MTPFRVPSTGGTQIGAMWIEQQRAESCRGHGAGKGGQLAAARGGGVAGAELSASQAGVGVKRHLVCKRWTIEKADENSNGIPWFVLHRPNSDKLRFHLPSL